jgi:flagellar basal body-associated protein FliL
MLLPRIWHNREKRAHIQKTKFFDWRQKLMADKKEENEKKADAKKQKAEGEGAGDTPKAASARSKIVIIGGIAGVVLIALSIGGFFAYKTFAAKAPSEAALQSPAPTDPAKEADHSKTPDAKKAEGDKAKAADAHGGEKKSGDEKKAAEAATTKPSEKSKKTLGSIYNIPKMELNVGGPDLNRGFVRIALAIEYVGEAEEQKELEARTPQYRDIIINKVASTPKNDLLTAKGREDLRKSILNAINTVNDQPIKSLYFTEFLVE